jgi:uncharacterized membrane protein
MQSHLFLMFTSQQIAMPAGSQFALLILRWLHVIAGITWVGLLYFFNLVNVPFLKELDPATRTAVVPRLMPKALWWFRWSSVVTVLLGLAYWMHLVAVDVHNANAAGEPASAFTPIASFFLLWTLAFVVEMGAVMSPADALKRGPVLGLIVAIAVIAAAVLFLRFNQNGWESNPTLAIGIGGGLGWFMMFNVWGIIWRMQKKMIRWTEAAAHGEAMPPEAAKLARLVFLTSRVNFWLSFPMLFFMNAASHLILFPPR